MSTRKMAETTPIVAVLAMRSNLILLCERQRAETKSGGKSVGWFW